MSGDMARQAWTSAVHEHRHITRDVTIDAENQRHSHLANPHTLSSPNTLRIIICSLRYCPCAAHLCFSGTNNGGFVGACEARNRRT